MKRIIALFLALVCLLGLPCCNSPQKKADTGSLPPTLIMNGKSYYANAMPVKELDKGFEYMGTLTDKEANNTGLEGCKYYTNKHLSSFDGFYVYQECGTPIDENTVDPTKRQWAYVKWVCCDHAEEEFPRLIMVNDTLYYDCAEESASMGRCGVMDGKIEKSVGAGNVIPTENGTSNFGIGYEYQYGAEEGTIEVYIQEKWCVFRKYEGGLTESLDKALDIISKDTKSPQIASEANPLGLTLATKNVSHTGLTLVFTQGGGNPTGTLQTGREFSPEINDRGNWKPLKTIIAYEEPIWTSEAYGIAKATTTEMDIDWRYLYGELALGNYRIRKKM